MDVCSETSSPGIIVGSDFLQSFSANEYYNIEAILIEGIWENRQLSRLLPLTSILKEQWRVGLLWGTLLSRRYAGYRGQKNCVEGMYQQVYFGGAEPANLGQCMDSSAIGSLGLLV